ncbi:putative alpha-L-glutamate ligase [Planktothrix tepida]|uniref:Probable alpha-L-glutamate ligase n=3 Tax=Planktothrix TaxID=54304 RepID=A0A1J1LI48_9CYAN|nr:MULTISPECIES: 30S ribosomal protein S6--L-glutamate ligase [Planktothrix]MBE9146396.1 30S ribosomal protein S6--L-glutamate ligase [Planktothrix mougeotii LEGE 06226]CAD5932888.1 putative alpha-L-glutamate ligase [Planktothrix tepida]CAD5977992.1 putative alpha-L-glutamate ligase [Planktothrix pseudagardhii]CUR31698.1 ribosomal protein S6 modification protein [Planktothrix tepida PCC 9214]
MKIAILSQDSSLYSTRRLRQAGEQRGHEIQIIDYLRCHISLNSKNPAIIYEGKPLGKFDAVIPRIGASKTFYGTVIVRQFELMGMFTLNQSQGITRSRDKLNALQALAQEGVKLPKTGFATSLKDIDSLINLVGGAPLIIKLLEGTQGMGVILADTYQSAKSIIEAFQGLNIDILVQEFIHEAEGSDLRCFVIGDKVIAAMKRLSNPGEFRANLHRGGKAENVKLTTEERNMAIKSAKVMGLKVAGVDMIRSDKGPLVLEVNSSPGLEGIEMITGIDVSDKIIEFLEKNVMIGGNREHFDKLSASQEIGNRKKKKNTPPGFEH